MSLLFLLLLSFQESKGSKKEAPKEPLGSITLEQVAEYWQLENAVSQAFAQCEPCQTARVERNKLVVAMQAICGPSRSLTLDSKRNPTCVAKEPLGSGSEKKAAQ